MPYEQKHEPLITEDPMARIHNAKAVVKQFKRAAGVIITEDREVMVPTGTATLGNKSWGKVDYLVNHCGYRLVR